MIHGNTSSQGKKPTIATIGVASIVYNTDGSASVSFTPPSYIGKGTATYRVTSNPGNVTATGSSSPITVTGLTAGTSYTFTVTAVTSYGVEADASAATSSYTAGNKPGPVSNVSATAGNAEASLSWTAGTAGTGTTTYTISVYRAGVLQGTTYSTTDTSRTMASLDNGVSYVFSVQAGNSYGAADGVASNAVTPVAPPYFPPYFPPHFPPFFPPFFPPHFPPFFPPGFK